MVEYTLNRSNRKTMGLYIRNGGVEVRAPLKTPGRDIDRFVASKEAWIREKLEASAERRERRESFALSYGDSVLYRGTERPITMRPGKHIGYDDELGCFYVPPGFDGEQIKYACARIYRMLAKRDFTGRVVYFAKQMSVAPTAVKINAAKTRWGSCSARKSLNFSWRLAMADDGVIDYVIVHELAHIIELNHSERFWAIVRDALPDFEARKARLKALQKKLSFEDWG